EAGAQHLDLLTDPLLLLESQTTSLGVVAPFPLVEVSTGTDHPFLDLSCQHGCGRAEVVADLLELVGDPGEELGITGGLAVLAVRHEMMDQRFGGALAVAVDAAVPLF